MAVPDGAAPLVVKALGAYMRAAPALDLPPEVRRLRNFHQKMLLAHAGDVLAMLDDATVRALVLQWMDDHEPALPKDQERALRLAAGQPEGWEDALADLAAPAAPAPDPSQKLRDALQREKDKVASAKEDARRLKESARKSLEDERAAAKELRRELTEARREAERNAAEAAQARADADRVRDELDKADRKAKKEVAAARAREEKATEGLRVARKELSAARRRIRELEQSLESAARPKAGRRQQPERSEPAPRGPRKRLRVPPGRLADDPMTLEAWLDADGVHLLVDGYNVTKSPEGFPDLELEVQRERLLEQLEKLALRKKVPTTVVFDGSDVGPGKSRPGRRRVRVEYSRPGEIADDHLIAKLRSLPRDPVVVVTGDRELQERAEAEGATIATAAQLLDLTR